MIFTLFSFLKVCSLSDNQRWQQPECIQEKIESIFFCFSSDDTERTHLKTGKTKPPHDGAFVNCSQLSSGRKVGKLKLSADWPQTPNASDVWSFAGKHHGLVNRYVNTWINFNTSFKFFCEYESFENEPVGIFFNVDFNFSVSSLCFYTTVDKHIYKFSTYLLW